jgi:hypothetical protein
MDAFVFDTITSLVPLLLSRQCCRSFHLCGIGLGLIWCERHVSLAIVVRAFPDLSICCSCGRARERTEESNLSH